MLAIDKLKSDLDGWQKRSKEGASQADLDRLRIIFSRAVGNIPEETVTSVYTSFLAIYGSNGPAKRDKALSWLATVGSLLLMDYDGNELSRDEWVEIREILTMDAGEIEMDILSYIMGIIMEHGAL